MNSEVRRYLFLGNIKGTYTVFCSSFYNINQMIMSSEIDYSCQSSLHVLLHVNLVIGYGILSLATWRSHLNYNIYNI